MHSVIKFSVDKVISIMIDYQRKIEKGSISFADKLYNLFVYGIFNFAFYKNTPEVVISFLQKTYYDKKIKELKVKLMHYQKDLKTITLIMQ